MKKIFILQNSNVSFELDAKLIYQPSKYDLYLIVNEFGYDALQARNQKQFYKETIVVKDFSEENVLFCIEQFLDDESIFNVITNSEETMPLCGRIRVRLGIDNSDYSRFYNKDIMKKCLSHSNAIKLPKYKLYHSEHFHQQGVDYLETLIQDLTFPLFIKPVSLYSSINLIKIQNKSELLVWANNNKTDDLYEIDEFIDGTMYHCDSFIKNGKILFTFVCQNSRPCYNFTIGEMKGTIVLPDYHPDAILLNGVTEKVLRDIGIPDAGVTHMEIIKTANNEIYFIEIAHRSPGCLIPRMYQTHAGINTVASHYLLQIDPDYYPKPEVCTYAAWACFPKIPGIIKNFRKPSKAITSSIEVDWKFNVNDQIHTYSLYGRDYIGTMFLTNDSFKTLYNDFEIVNNDNLCVYV